VTWSLIVANVLIFLIELGNSDMDGMISRFGVIPAAFSGEVIVEDGLPPVLTLVSYMFLHADWLHILGNMVFLWVFGDDIERALGRGRFLGFYLGCGVLAALAFVMTGIHAQGPLIGASGAIAGIVIAYAMLKPCAKITVLALGIPMRVRAYWVIGAFVLIQFINLGSASSSDVAYWCHIGGMVAGAVLFPLMRRPGVQLFECMRGSKEPVAVTPDADGAH
jgi:membrane associated rhomboid family serine protease